MSKKVFEVYQYVAPAILVPLSFWLWWQTFEANLWLTLIAWAVPILYAYIVPAVGTNILKVWEFDTAIRLGRFRPHHGFVFGSATSVLAWLCYSGLSEDGFDVVRQALVFASVLGFWNILYDILALKSGFLHVYNQPWADGKEPEVIAMDYAPWFFGGFGVVYGAGLAIAEIIDTQLTLDMPIFMSVFFAILVLSIVLPVMGYRHRSFRVHGHSGCRPISRENR